MVFLDSRPRKNTKITQRMVPVLMKRTVMLITLRSLYQMVKYKMRNSGKKCRKTYAKRTN